MNKEQQPLEQPAVFRAWSKTQGELHLILKSWLGNLRNNPTFGAVPTQLYFQNYRPLVKRIVEESEVMVACSEDDADHILAFIVYRYIGDVPVISYVFVKHAFRRMRLADKLIRAVMSKQAEGLEGGAMATNYFTWLKPAFHKYNLVYNPFLDLQFLGEKT